MAELRLNKVSKVYPGGVHAVRDADVTVADREFVVLVGPSGCGKSTLLRMVAGLEIVTSGEIQIAGRRVNEMAPRDRDIAMVFQSYALYPHMTVYDNMALGLKLRKVPREEARASVLDAARMLGIEELLDRRPRQLSGGQRQRVAVGRAIVRKPQVFLFDEPLSNLDAKKRVQTRAEIASLHRRLQATILYVTHDQVEAMTMGQRIVVMKDGAIQQIGAPLDVYQNPQSRFVAEFVGSPSMNFLRLQPHTSPQTRATTSGALLEVDAGSSCMPDRACDLGVRPEHVSIDSKPPDWRSAAHCSGTVAFREALGSETLVHVDLGGGVTWVAAIRGTTPHDVGQAVSVWMNLGGAHFFDPTSGLPLQAMP